ncbi:MAG: universal stress protein [Pseudomonadota bacterium]
MQRFKRILVACSGDSAYEDALERVAWLAGANAAQVTLLDLTDTKPGELSRILAALPGPRARDVEGRIADARRDRLGALAEPLRAKGIAVDTVVAEGTAFVETIRQVLRGGHDLLIKGAQRSADRPFFRGTDMHLMRKCPCPVWILNSRSEPQSVRILAAVDPDPQDPGRDALNVKILELATALAAQDDAQLDVIKVWRVAEEAAFRHPMINMPADEIAAVVAKEEAVSAARLDALLDRFTDHADRIRRLHVQGIAADTILDHVAAERIDTVVMGSLGRTGVAGYFIGNTAETVLSRITSSVLALKPEGFVSPVTLGDGA